MPRVSDVIRFPGGTAIVCRSERYQQCSTPGCRNHARLLCDFPVKRGGVPKYGDARTHRKSGRVWYVWNVDGNAMVIAQAEPPKRSFAAKRRWPKTGAVDTTPADWFAKTVATCDRRICSGCALVTGKDRHYCKPHARFFDVQIRGQVGEGGEHA